MKNFKEVNKVYLTNDLSIFKLIKGNRSLNPRHVKRLADSFNKYGILMNPIIVNENMEVIDGQNRLAAAKEVGSSIYFLIVHGYELRQVQVLNLNQKNWSKVDFIKGYADMGYEPYKKLLNFMNLNSDFNSRDCIAMCGNVVSAASRSIGQAYTSGTKKTVSEVLEEGTWKGRDFNLAQINADKIREIKIFYDGYNRSSFVQAILGILSKPEFKFDEFIHKLSLQSTRLKDCPSVSEYKVLIEEIYNYRRNPKINLRF